MGYPVPTDAPALSNQQRMNLHALQRYLDTLPADYAHFNMGVFYERHPSADIDETTGRPDDYEDSIEPGDIRTGRLEADPSLHGAECGSAACAIGHGPAAGVAIQPGEGMWQLYAVRAFGMCPHGWDDRNRGHADYVFGTENPDSPHEAAKRIRHVLSLTCH